MSTTHTEEFAPRLRRRLAPYADEYEHAAEQADRLEIEDSARILAAIANGEHPPDACLERLNQRLTEQA